MSRELYIEYMSINELMGYPKNPKKHALGDIMTSFHRFGFVSPIIINEKNKMLLAGHGRIRVLNENQMVGDTPPDGVKVENGIWMVPVVRGVEIAEDDHGAYVLADNEISAKGGNQASELLKLLQELDATTGLEGTGFNSSDIEDLLKKLDDVTDDMETGNSDFSGMDLESFEHHDYIVLAFHDSRDWLKAAQLLGVKKVQLNKFRKTSHVGYGRVIDGNRLFDVPSEK